MRDTTRIVLLILFALSGFAFGPQLESKVFTLQVKGKVIYRLGTQEPQPLKWGQRIMPDYVIELGSDGYLKIADSTRMAEFSGSRLLTFTEIQSSLKKGLPERTKDVGHLLRYFWGQISHLWSMLETGGEDTLARAAVRANRTSIRRQIPLAPRNGAVVGDSIQLTWFNDRDEPYQRMVILDRDFNVVFQHVVTGRALTLSAVRLHLELGQTYYWSVNTLEVGRHDVPFKVADVRLTRRVNAEIRQVAALGELDPAAQHLLRAFVYEQNQCHGNAYYEYATAVQYDTSSTVNGLFTLFLVDKLGLSDLEAATVINDLRKR